MNTFTSKTILNPKTTLQSKSLADAEHISEMNLNSFSDEGGPPSLGELSSKWLMLVIARSIMSSIHHHHQFSEFTMLTSTLVDLRPVWGNWFSPSTCLSSRVSHCFCCCTAYSSFLLILPVPPIS